MTALTPLVLTIGLIANPTPAGTLASTQQATAAQVRLDRLVNAAEIRLQKRATATAFAQGLTALNAALTREIAHASQPTPEVARQNEMKNRDNTVER